MLAIEHIFITISLAPFPYSLSLPLCSCPATFLRVCSAASSSSPLLSSHPHPHRPCHLLSLSLSLSLFFLVLSSRLWDLDLLGHPGGPVHAEAPGAAVALDRGIVPAAVGVEGVDLSKGGDLVAQGRGDCAADGILLKLHVAEGGQDGELGGDCAAQAVVD